MIFEQEAAFESAIINLRNPSIYGANISLNTKAFCDTVSLINQIQEDGSLNPKCLKSTWLFPLKEAAMAWYASGPGQRASRTWKASAGRCFTQQKTWSFMSVKDLLR